MKKKPKRYDKNYTAAENREIRILKGQGWTNNEIAQHMGRTEIGISRHWSNINKRTNVQSINRRTMSGKDRMLISETMREVCEGMGFRKPFVNFYHDPDQEYQYSFKVFGGYKWPEAVWHRCLKEVQKLGYCSKLGHSVNYYENTDAHSRGVRVKV